jgi:hypothetical protein
MTLQNFNNLTDETKLQIVWNNGKPLAMTEDANFSYVIYKVMGFKVELRYEKNSNKLPAVKGFTNVLESTALCIHPN